MKLEGLMGDRFIPWSILSKDLGQNPTGLGRELPNQGHFGSPEASSKGLIAQQNPMIPNVGLLLFIHPSVVILVIAIKTVFSAQRSRALSIAILAGACSCAAGARQATRCVSEQTVSASRGTTISAP